MARVTNEQLATRLDSVDTRLTNVETILMSNSRRNGSVSPLVVLLIRWVVFPLIVIIGSVIGVTQYLPIGG